MSPTASEEEPSMHCSRMSPDGDLSSEPLSNVPVATLQRVRLDLLQAGNAAEAEKLFGACRKEGFFYLDFQHAKSVVSEVVEQIYILEEELFNLREQEKLRYDVDKLSKMKLNGYKPLGRNFGGIKGKLDGFETYSISKNNIKGLDDPINFARPAVIDKHMSTLKAFTDSINDVSTVLLSTLSCSLGLPADEGLEKYHKPDTPSPDIIRLLKYHAQPAEELGICHTPHTDMGSLTFLFTRQPGLQVLSPVSGQWEWVQPITGCAIVNLGDGMSLLTNGYFHSCLHRVGPLPGRSMQLRYSFAYLQRAEEETPMTGLKSNLFPTRDPEAEVFTSGEWLQRKFGMLRLETHKNDDSWVLTGRKNGVPN